MGDDILGCTLCLKKFPKRKHWQLARLKIEFLGCAIEAQICPECQSVVGKDYKIVNRHWDSFRNELLALLPTVGADAGSGD